MSAVHTAPAGASSPVGDFSTWVSPHLPVMMSPAARLVTIPADRDDVVQDALTAAWRKRRSYDAARGTPRSWLLAIVADQARKTWRRQRSTELVVVPCTPIDRPTSTSNERSARCPDANGWPSSCTTSSTCPSPRVATAMGCSIGTVKATLSHARSHLHRDLGEEL